jgi:hypothetical protein
MRVLPSHVDTLSTAGDNPGENFTPDDLITFLCRSLAVLWREWPTQMKLTVLEAEAGKFTLSGECPHCYATAVFIQVTSLHAEEVEPRLQRLTVGMQCQGCLEHILAVVIKQRESGKRSILVYATHYPLGKPNDNVADEVAAANPVIALDFAEALRCLWVGSYKAAVAMCRRSVEATCKHLGATGRTLEQKIDNLAAQGKITESLKEWAHAVRLSGNRALHGKKTTDAASGDQQSPLDDLDFFGEDEAKAMIVFTQQLFQNVFIMPALSEKYKPKPEREASEEP